MSEPKEFRKEINDDLMEKLDKIYLEIVIRGESAIEGKVGARARVYIEIFEDPLKIL